MHLEGAHEIGPGLVERRADAAVTNLPPLVIIMDASVEIGISGNEVQDCTAMSRIVL